MAEKKLPNALEVQLACWKELAARKADPRSYPYTEPAPAVDEYDWAAARARSNTDDTAP